MGLGARSCAVLWLLGASFGAGGCTEPNPYVDGADSSTGTTGETSGGPSSTTMSSASTSPDSTATMGTTDATTEPTTADPTGDPTTDPTGDDTTTGAPVCPADTHACVPLPPEGWDGPAALIVEDATLEATPCEGEFPTLGDEAFSDLVAPQAVCDCECGDPVGVDCTDTQLSGSTTDCANFVATVMLPNTNCVVAPAAFNNIAADEGWRALSTVTGGSCAEITTAEVTPAEFAQRTSLCVVGALDPTGCVDGSVCVSNPGAPFAPDRVCIWQLADVECPDPWTDRTLVHQSMADDRDCTACSCGDPEGACSGSVTLLNQTNCGGAALGNIPIEDDCNSGVSPLSVFGVRQTALPEPVAPTCSPSDSTPVGGADPTEPVTVCCLP